MTDRIIEILNKNNIKNYGIYDEIRESAELFFIKHRTDLIRSRNVREIRLRVYRDFDSFRGSSDVYLYPCMDYEEMEKSIMSAYNSAGYVKNPYFELPAGISSCRETEKEDLRKWAFSMAEALYDAENLTEGAFINSAEISAIRKSVRITDSAGCLVSYTKTGIEGEFVVQCITDENDVEQYHDFNYDCPDVSAIRDKAVNALKSVKDRATAVKAPADLSGIPVIITDKNVRELLGIYLDRCNASYIYPGYSPYKKGFVIQKNVHGERLNISGYSVKPFSDEGVPMTERELVRDGVVTGIHGTVPFMSYIGEEQTGEYECIRCTNGTVNMEELCRGDYIMVKSFSDFQADAMDGHFGGEFRLAYLCRNGVKSIVTGGTVSGSLFEDGDKMVFSSERYRDAFYDGPAAVRIG